jgi:hypothetical protein
MEANAIFEICNLEFEILFESHVTAPGGDLRLREGSWLAIFGTHEAMRRDRISTGAIAAAPGNDLIGSSAY